MNTEGVKAAPGEVQAVQLADVGEVAADQVRQLLPLLLAGRALLGPRAPLHQVQTFTSSPVRRPIATCCNWSPAATVKQAVSGLLPVACWLDDSLLYVLSSTILTLSQTYCVLLHFTWCCMRTQSLFISVKFCSRNSSASPVSPASASAAPSLLPAASAASGAASGSSPRTAWHRYARRNRPRTGCCTCGSGRHLFQVLVFCFQLWTEQSCCLYCYAGKYAVVPMLCTLRQLLACNLHMQLSESLHC
jgi:hypothetical protein